MNKTRVIINDISFSRFCRELVGRMKEYPTFDLVESYAGDDKRAENAFMFVAILEGFKQ